MTCLILLNCKKDVLLSTKNIEALPWWFKDKESACSAGDMGLIPGSGRSPGEGNGKPPLYFLPEKSSGQRILVVYSPSGHKRVRHVLVTEQQQKNIACSYYIYQSPKYANLMIKQHSPETNMNQTLVF